MCNSKCFWTGLSRFSFCIVFVSNILSANLHLDWYSNLFELGSNMTTIRSKIEIFLVYDLHLSSFLGEQLAANL